MEIVFYISAFIILSYVIIISSFALGWYLIKPYKQKTISDHPKTSIVVACRNEEKNISKLLKSLTNQNYPKDKTEIIIVNDHSEDETEKIICNQVSESIKLLNLPENIKGKKAALHYGISLATSEIILTTDADCTMSTNWIVSMVSYYLIHKPKLLVGPVVFRHDESIFQKFQVMEFMSLVGSGAGAIGINHPIMCNGANLLFEKSVFENTLHANKYASGDDIFLLLQIKKKYKKGIHFIKTTDAIVYTNPSKNIKDFIAQRIRWTSKSKAYRDTDIISTAVIVAIMNLMLTFSLVALICNMNFLFIYLFIFAIKTIADLLIILSVSKFFSNQKLLVYFIPLQFFYPFYIVFTIFFGLIGKFEWKKRSFG